MKTIGITFALATCLISVTSACVAPGSEEGLEQAPSTRLEATVPLDGLVLPAQTDEQWRLFMASNDTSRVRSMEGWQRCLLDAACNPLIGIDSDIVDAFTRSLVFRNGGLAGARPDLVEDLLSYDAYLSLWNKFGIGEDLVSAWADYECVGVGTCRERGGSICTDNC